MQAFFCPLTKKLSVEKTQIKPGPRKILGQFWLQNSMYRRPFLATNWKKNSRQQKPSYFPLKNSYFFLKNSMHRRPPALTSLQKSGQKIAWVSDLIFNIKKKIFSRHFEIYRKSWKNLPQSRSLTAWTMLLRVSFTLEVLWVGDPEDRQRPVFLNVLGGVAAASFRIYLIELDHAVMG